MSDTEQVPRPQASAGAWRGHMLSFFAGAILVWVLLSSRGDRFVFREGDGPTVKMNTSTGQAWVMRSGAWAPIAEPAKSKP